MLNGVHGLQVQPDMVELLLSHQAKVNAFGAGDKTPLLLSAGLSNSDGKRKILKLLLESDANVEATLHSGE